MTDTTGTSAATGERSTLRAAITDALLAHGGWTADLPADEMDCCVNVVMAAVEAHSPAPLTNDAVLSEIRHHINPAIGRNRLREADGQAYDFDDLDRAFDAAAAGVVNLNTDGR